MTIGENRYLCSNGSCSYPCPMKLPSGYCPLTCCVNQNAQAKVQYKTYEELLEEFKVKYAFGEIEDYRPFDNDFVKGKTGIVVWMKSGDVLVYYPQTITKRIEE